MGDNRKNNGLGGGSKVIETKAVLYEVVKDHNQLMQFACDTTNLVNANLTERELEKDALQTNTPQFNPL